jgi:hypothetical protein
MTSLLLYSVLIKKGTGLNSKKFKLPIDNPFPLQFSLLVAAAGVR